MAHQVNLDALIPREDFDVNDEGAPAVPTATTQIRNLERGDFFYGVLRKPDFQRETSDWSPDKICGFVESFLEGDLIPALILWQAGSQIFVIDGAHRLSALIAWVHDDYGDGPTSRIFFDGIIPEDQVLASEHTRKLIKRKIGTYEDYKLAVQYPDKFQQEIVTRAKRLASLSIQLQWVKGNASKAEESFFKINQQATPINKTELKLLKSRTHPNALAARAIVRSGTGHKYWARFDPEIQQQIESIAKNINDLLFSPNLKSPIKTLDLPVAGKGYSSQTLPLVFDFVNLANDIKSDSQLDADSTGENTLDFLKTCRAIVNRISGTHPSSLGLHPAIYFYSGTGRYQPTSFMALIELIKEYERRDYFKEFIKVRSAFEKFFLKYRLLVNQVTNKYGSGQKGYYRLYQLYLWVIDQFLQGYGDSDIVANLAIHPDFSFLQPSEIPESNYGEIFGTEAKSAVFLRDALREPLKCGICDGLIHRNAISIDHIQRKSEGGLGSPDNGQLTHPYCNTTIKN